jgi:hypothetical protein
VLGRLKSVQGKIGQARKYWHEEALPPFRDQWFVTLRTFCQRKLFNAQKSDDTEKESRSIKQQRLATTLNIDCTANLWNGRYGNDGTDLKNAPRTPLLAQNFREEFPTHNDGGGNLIGQGRHATILMLRHKVLFGSGVTGS